MMFSCGEISRRRKDCLHLRSAAAAEEQALKHRSLDPERRDSSRDFQRSPLNIEHFGCSSEKQVQPGADLRSYETMYQCNKQRKEQSHVCFACTTTREADAGAKQLTRPVLHLLTITYHVVAAW